jgi:hypothetical protein
MASLNVILVHADNTEHPAELLCTDAILWLKEKAEQSHFLWTWNKEILSDEKTLADYDIKAGDRIYVESKKKAIVAAAATRTVKVMSRIQPWSAETVVKEKGKSKDLGLF